MPQLLTVLILVDARNGVIEQTKRHTFIADLLGIKHVAVCINKMDLVDYNQESYEKILNQFTDFASRLENVTDLTFIPISALKGDNVVDRSESMPWYKGLPCSTIWKMFMSDPISIILTLVFQFNG